MSANLPGANKLDALRPDADALERGALETGGLDAERLLSFEIGGTLYALPIADVAEVAEVSPVTAVPTLATRVGGVVNHHGDALPVVRADALLDLGDRELPQARHLLVLARDPDDPSRYGLPVDKIVGLVDGPFVRATGDDPVCERRPIDGRLLSVLDPERLLSLAAQVVESSVHTEPPSQETQS